MRIAIALALVLHTTVARAEDTECASPAACRPQCTAGNQSACAWLGESYVDDIGLVQIPAYANVGVRILDQACAKGSGEACAALAQGLEDIAAYGKKDSNIERHDELEEKACKAGYPDACLPLDLDRDRLWEKRCSGGDARSCLAAARAFVSPTPDSPEKQRVIEQAREAGVLPPEPKNKPDSKKDKPDPKKGERLLARGKKLIAEACAHKRARTCSLGDDKASEEKACSIGASVACTALADKNKDSDPSAWLSYATRACELGEFMRCEMVGKAYALGEHHVAVDLVKSAKFVQMACDFHDSLACAGLAKLEKDPAKARVLFVHACDDGDTTSCDQANMP
jgi:TPR repeat protein